MAPKNNKSSTSTVTCFCPNCDARLQLVLKFGEGPNGKFISCSVCDFQERYARGRKQYTRYRYEVR